MSYVSIGHDGHIWSIGADGKTIYYRQGVAQNNLEGSSWATVDGNLFMVEVGDCQVYGIAVDHTIWKRINVNPQDKMGTNWVQSHGSLMHISVGYGPVLWGVDWGHNVWFKLIGAIKQQGQDGWTEVDKPDGVAKMVNIDVGRDGHVWGVDDVNKVYYRHGISASAKKGTHWAEVPESNFVDVAVCTDGHVWAIGTDNKIYYRTMIVDDDQVGQGWELAEDHLCQGGVCQNEATQVSCGGGNVLVLGANQ
jgi:hypothetical protein